MSCIFKNHGKRKIHELDGHGAKLPSQKVPKHNAEATTMVHGTNDLIQQINALPWDQFLQQHIPDSSLQYHPCQHNEAPGPTKQQLNYEIQIKHVLNGTTHLSGLRDDMTDSELERCYVLIEQTSGEAYRASGFGWHPRRKKREMREKDMRYLLIRRSAQERDQDPDETLQGFLSFMLTYEDGCPVIYVYEIHLTFSARGCGLGRHLIDIVETIGKSAQVEKCMLTVFRSNEQAWRWYEKLGYEIDEYSPPDKKLRGGKVKQADYLILSRNLQ